jgi:transcriptional regulator with XRE-family HTH domain
MQDIRSLRLARKIRQRDLAQALDISVHELSKIERCLWINQNKSA